MLTTKLGTAFYRKQKITVRTERHDETGEPAELTLPLYLVGLMAHFQCLSDEDDDGKPERAKELESLLWETIVETLDPSQFSWQSRWCVVGFEPPEND